jgi:hypothetical protein
VISSQELRSEKGIGQETLKEKGEIKTNYKE